MLHNTSIKLDMPKSNTQQWFGHLFEWYVVMSDPITDTKNTRD